METQQSRFLRFNLAKNSSSGFQQICSLGLIGALALAALGGPPDCFAQTEPKKDNAAKAEEAEKAKPKKEEPKENVRTGIIASSGIVGVGNKGAVGSDTGDSAPGGEQNFIAASVSNGGDGSCSATVKNNSEKTTYRVRFTVFGVNQRGRKVVNKSFSARLKPGGTSTKSLPCKADYSMGVNLRSATPAGE